MKKIERVDRSDFIVMPISSEKEEELKNLTSTKFASQEILKFIAVLEKQPNVDLTIFFNNLESLSVSKNDPFFVTYKKLKRERITALYLIMKNIIHYDEFSHQRDLYHELLHAATALINYDRDVVICGFDQLSRNRKIRLGKPLNEGYTELLVDRFFQTGGFSTNYPNEKNMAKIVEEAIGQPLMQRSYFSANLDNVIQALTKYDSEENVLKFLANYKAFRNGKLNKKVNHFLLSIYLQSLFEKIRNENLSSDEVITRLATYFRSFGISCMDDVSKDMLGSLLADKVVSRFEEIEIQERNSRTKQIINVLKNR